MAGLFDYQDPESVGRMMFAAGLLGASGPSKMPISTGQAIAQGLLKRQEGATEAAQTARRNLLIDAQIRHMAAQDKSLAEKAKYADMPANVKAVKWYMSEATPEEREFYRWNLRNNIFDMNGIKMVNEPGGVRPAMPWEVQVAAGQDTAAAKAFGTESGKAPWELKSAVIGNKDVFATTPDILASIGRSPTRPPLSAFGHGAPLPSAPRLGQPQTFSQPPAYPTSRPNPDAVGLDAERGYPSTAALGAAIRESGQRDLEALSQPSADGAGQIQPPAAGDAERERRKKEADLAETHKAKLRESYPKAKGSISALHQNVDQGLDQIKKLENSRGEWWNTGYVSNIPLRYVKGHPAYDDEVAMDVLRNKAVIETMKALKELSQTGSTGFGQLTEKEGGRLENNVASLATGQSAEARKAALQEIKKAFQNIKDNAQKTFDLEFGSFEMNSLRDKYGLK